MHKFIHLLLASGFLWISPVAGQGIIKHSFNLNWSPSDQLVFEDAKAFEEDSRFPVYITTIPLVSSAQLSVELMPVEESTFTLSDQSLFGILPSSYKVGSKVEQFRGKWYAQIWVCPIAEVASGEFVKIIQGELQIHITPEMPAFQWRSGPEFKDNSVLSTGTIHRISVAQSGVYRLDYNFIKDKMKIDPSTISPDRIAIFGNGEGRVPKWNSAPRIDDLEQSATMSVGLVDGVFNQGDYLLWYAQGPHRWTFSPQERIYNMELNNYDVVNHYYVIVNGPTREKIASQVNESAGDYVSSTSIEYQRLEDEITNLLGRYRPPGSGQEWYGDEMAVVKQIDYTNRFDLRDLVPSDTLNYKVRFAARSASVTRFYIKFNEIEASRNVGGVILGNYESSFANDALLQGVIIPGAPINQLIIRYPDANGVNSRGWVDNIQLNFWKSNLYRSGTLLNIRDPRASLVNIPEYNLSGLTSGCQIWDVTNPLVPFIQAYEFGTTSKFVRATTGEIPNHFICFNTNTDVLSPTYEKAVANQNLHSIQEADLIIVYYDEFEEAAQKLGNHRASFSDLNVVTVPSSQVYEEFGGGSQDPAAIRDFARMVYKRDAGFKYLCLIGDATYDYLNHFPDLPFQNFIPAFETWESLDPIRSFPSDDFYALLDDEEGDDLIGAIDIAVGRLPVSTADEALKIVDKIIFYDQDPSTLNDWRSRIVMVADDEDSNTHLNQADGLAVLKTVENPELNIQKIYLDAFPQESTPGGDRYPDVNDNIDLNMGKGALTITYLGHGGQNGWTQERVLGINQAQSYDNVENMPLFITATCSFASYDEPGFTSAGEHLLLNPDGGAIALMTTVRAVYSGSNERLTRAVMKLLYKPDDDGSYPSFAEVLRRSKNTNAIDTLDNNARKFTLLGDPAQKLAIPNYGIAVTEIGGNAVGMGMIDTLSALEKTRISGYVAGHQGEILTDFNGLLYLTVFDKVQVRKTLANDEGSSVRPFNTQNRQLFKGTASVEAGLWTIEFVLPKDIDFSYGNGKLSMYAQNGITDATGYFTDFIIGGVSKEGLTDDEPPLVKLFMNDSNFVFGGITDANPDIYVQLSDDNGINASGSSIGHDIEAILDGDDINSFILNDFYAASLNDYSKGEVRYPLSSLAPGRHTLKVIAWDLANNPGEAYLEFVVLEDGSAVIEDLFCYPNPFKDRTYFQFEHNRPDATMDLEINIFDLSGRQMGNISIEDYVSGGYRVDKIEWDGVDYQGRELNSGLYIYKLRATITQNGIKEVVDSDGEKLVIIR